MAVELGVGYVNVVPSARGFSSSLTRQLAPIATSAGRDAGDKAGAGFSQRFSAGIGAIAASVGRTFVSIASLGAVAAAGFAATSIFKGWDRLTTIQDATAALTVQLGDAGAAAQLLSKVLDIVKGTPFSLDVFQSAAANLVAMGVSAQKVPAYLTAIGEASATKGKQANAFAERLANTFGRVSAQGRIMGQDINDLAGAGVNALAILANHFGVTTDEMREMISDGAVPAGEALDALADGIVNGSDGIAGATVALGGTMQTLGKQLSGSAENFKIAIARFGASLIAPFSPALTEGFGIATTLIDNLGARVGALAQRFVDSPGFQAFLVWLRTVPEKIGPLLDKLSGFGPIIAAAGVALGTLGAQQIPILGQLVSGLNPFVAGIAALVLASPELRKALGDAFEAIKPSLAQVAKALAPALVDIAKALADMLIAVVPLIPPLARLFALIVKEIGVPGIKGIAAAFREFADVLRNNREVFIGFAVAIGTVVVAAIYSYTVAMIAAAVATLAFLAPVLLVAAGLGLLVAGVLLVWNNWDTIWNAIRDHPAIAAIVAILAWPIAAVILLIGAIKTLYENWDSIWSEIQSVLDTAWGFIRGVFDAIVGSLGWIGVAASIIKGAWDGMFDGISRAWDTVKGIVNGAIAVLRTLVDIATTAADIIQDIAGTGGGSLSDYIKAHPEALKRAAGGPVRAGQPYIVGEHRPELFIPDVSGTIMPQVPGGGLVIQNATFGDWNVIPDLDYFARTRMAGV